MAFNPFSNFQKYRQFWMASILLTTMVTFVLCTGTGGGDFAGWLSNLLGRKGTAIFTLGGRSYSDNELHEIRNRRTLANRFMIESARMGRHKLLEYAEKEAANLKLQARNPEEMTRVEGAIGQAYMVANVLHQRAKKAHYFEGGATLDDMVDFLVWLKQADRLGVELLDEHVIDLYNIEMFVGVAGLTGRELLHAVHAARSGERVSEQTLIQALRDEYRVKIAQLALERSPSALQHLIQAPIDVPPVTRLPLTPAQLFDFYKHHRSTVDITLIPVRAEDFVKDVKSPTEAELKSFFELHKKRGYDPSGDTPGFEIPRRIKAEWISAKDPNSPHFQNLANAAFRVDTMSEANWSPGLGTAGWVRLAVGELLQDEVLERQFFGQVFGTIMAKDYHEGAELGHADVLTPMVIYRNVREPKTIASWIGASALSGFTPDQGLSAMVATAHARYGLKALPEKSQDKAEKARLEEWRTNLAAALRRESRRRAPLYATLPSLGSMGSAFTPLASLHLMSSAPRADMPVQVYKDEVLKRYQENLARSWVGANMAKLRSALTSVKQHNQDALERVLNSKEFAGLGLERVKTDKFHSRFSLEHAKELAPLVESFKKNYEFLNIVQGRTGKEVLKETDFYKLFESGESFAPADRYEAKPWPPDLIVKGEPFQVSSLVQLWLGRDRPTQGLKQYLDTLQGKTLNQRETTFPLFSLTEGKPFLFWKTEEEKAEVAASMDKVIDHVKIKDKVVEVTVRDKVREAWLVEKARDDIAWPKAKKIAERLQQTSFGQVRSELERIAKEMDRGPEHPWSPVYLRDVSRLKQVTVTNLGARREGQLVYEPYTLEPDKIPFPRDDTVANLLNLYQLKEPFEAKIDAFKELDEVNKKLFDATHKRITDMGEKPEVALGKFVQVLTNKPRTVFYVAVVTSPVPITDKEDFLKSYLLSNIYERDFQGRIMITGDGQPNGPRDTFVQRAHEEAAKEFRQRLMAQLRENLGYRPDNLDKARGLFDQGEP